MTEFHVACSAMFMIGLVFTVLGYLDQGEGLPNHKDVMKLGAFLMVTPVVTFFLKATFGF